MTYKLLRAAAANGGYVEIGAATVDSNGNASYDDNGPLPNTAFYRVVYY